MLPDTAAVFFEMVRPNLEAGRKKAEGAGKALSGRLISLNPEDTDRMPVRCPEDTDRMPVRCPEDTDRIPAGSCEDTASKNKNKDKNKIKNKDNSLCADFARFWEAYPRKEGKQNAELVFRQTGVSVEILLEAIERQKQSDQWTREGGRFIPLPANWLSGKRWEDRPVPAQTIPKGASGNLGQAELEAIQSLMSRRQDRDGMPGKMLP